MTTACSYCRSRKKTWHGDDPSCAFPDNNSFTSENWNCAAANLIRELIEERTSSSSDSDNRISKQYQYDDWSATISIYDIELKTGDADSLWVAWYKQRGRTEAMWLLSRYTTPRLPTEEDIQAILDEFQKRS